MTIGALALFSNGSGLLYGSWRRKRISRGCCSSSPLALVPICTSSSTIDFDTLGGEGRNCADAIDILYIAWHLSRLLRTISAESRKLFSCRQTEITRSNNNCLSMNSHRDIIVRKGQTALLQTFPMPAFS